MNEERSDKKTIDPGKPQRMIIHGIPQVSTGSQRPEGLIVSRKGASYLEGTANEMSSILQEMNVQTAELRRDVKELCEYHESRQARLEEKLFYQLHSLREDLGLGMDPMFQGCG